MPDCPSAPRHFAQWAQVETIGDEAMIEQLNRAAVAKLLDRIGFVHISAVEKAGLSNLNEGQTVEYEIVSNRGKESADHLKVRG
jgi:hypothetical protein